MALPRRGPRTSGPAAGVRRLPVASAAGAGAGPSPRWARLLAWSRAGLLRRLSRDPADADGSVATTEPSRRRWP